MESGGKNIGLLVDGPNMLRKEFSLNLDLVRDIMAEYGNMRVGKVLLNQYASDKLIEAIVNQGVHTHRSCWRHRCLHGG